MTKLLEENIVMIHYCFSLPVCRKHYAKTWVHPEVSTSCWFKHGTRCPKRLLAPTTPPVFYFIPYLWKVQYYISTVFCKLL